MEYPERYAELVKRSQVHYLEIKGYSAIGRSRQRLGLKFSPTHDEIKVFASELERFTEYKYSDEQPSSHIVLLSRDEESHEHRIIKFDELVEGREPRFVEKGENNGL